jgi:hypothetical protein
LKLVAEKEKKSTDLKTPLKINKTTGKESSTPLAFSELNWGQFTTDYHLSIVKRGPKYTTDTIAMARQFVKDLGSDASTKGSLADDSVASSKGERALLCEYFSNLFCASLMYFTRISLLQCLFATICTLQAAPTTHTNASIHVNVPVTGFLSPFPSLFAPYCPLILLFLTISRF